MLWSISLHTIGKTAARKDQISSSDWSGKINDRSPVDSLSLDKGECAEWQLSFWISDFPFNWTVDCKYCLLELLFQGPPAYQENCARRKKLRRFFTEEIPLERPLGRGLWLGCGPRSTSVLPFWDDALEFFLTRFSSSSEVIPKRERRGDDEVTTNFLQEKQCKILSAH